MGIIADLWPEPTLHWKKSKYPWHGYVGCWPKICEDLDITHTIYSSQWHKLHWKIELATIGHKTRQIILWEIYRSQALHPLFFNIRKYKCLYWNDSMRCHVTAKSRTSQDKVLNLKCRFGVTNRGPLSPHQPSSTLLVGSLPAQEGFPRVGLLGFRAMSSKVILKSKPNKTI